jgi:hypothetical protein
MKQRPQFHRGIASPHRKIIKKIYAGYISWLHSYLTNRLSHVRYSAALSSPFELVSVVLPGSVLGPLLFNVCINDLCNVIIFYNYLIFADDKHFSGHKVSSRLFFTSVGH